MKTLSFSVTDQTQLQQLLQEESSKGNAYKLAIVFASTECELEPVQAIFREFEMNVCGCSTAGEISGGTLETNCITGLLVDAPKDSFKLWTGLAGSVSSQAETLGNEADTTFSNPQIFVLSGGLTNDGEEIIDGIKRGAGRDLPTFGGLGADDFKMERTYSFSESDTIDNGLVAVIFDGDLIKLEGNAISGWEPIGLENEITSAEGNVVHEINGKSALEFYSQFIGAANNTEFTEDIATVTMLQYPLQIIRPEGVILRAPSMPHPNGTSIILVGGVRTGDRFRFSIIPGFEVIEETVGHFRANHNEDRQPDGVLMISCKARHAAFGPMLEDEIEQIAELYKAPMAGYLSYGEIGAIDERGTALHNDTCCIVRLYEV
ncbi:MAG: FIST signal transduction protein [Saprospiraceae bacterium]